MKQLAYLFVITIDSLNDWFGKVVAWLILIMTLVTFTIVILRYVFQEGWIGLQEAVGYMHGLVFMLGIAYTFKHDGHVRLDIFFKIFPIKPKLVSI